MLPTDVVAALCRFRDAENCLEQSSYNHHLVGTLSETKLNLPKAALEPIAALDFPQPTTTDAGHDGRYPSIETLYEEISQQIENKNFESIVFAGEGEPTLRIGALLNIAKRISQQNKNDIPIRVTTNGLVAAAHKESTAANLLKSSGVSSVSLALMTHDADQYDDIMQPQLPPHLSEAKERAHGIVIQFLKDAVSVGIGVEITAVERPDVDKSSLETYSRKLGIPKPVRWRPYFP